MQSFLATILVISLPVLALVWLFGLTRAWQGKSKLSYSASALIVLWPVLVLGFVTLFKPGSGDGSGLFAMAVVLPLAFGAGIVFGAVAFLVSMAGRFARSKSGN